MINKADPSPEEIADVLNKWGVKGRCPMCEHNDWAVKTRAAYSRIYASREEESERDTEVAGFVETVLRLR